MCWCWRLVAPAVKGTDPLTIVQDYYAAINTGDVDAAMAFVSPDAVFFNPSGFYNTPEEIRASLEQGVNDHATFDLSNFRVDGGRVLYDYKILVNGSSVESGTDGLTIVESGQIVFDGTERTEKSLP